MLLKAMLQTWRSNKSDQNTIKQLQQQRLRRLVQYARANSPYYKSLYAGVAEDFRLEDLPTTSKPEMMSRLDEVFTDRRITTDRMDDFTKDIDNVGRMMDGKYLIFKTSGSTGHPATVLYDQNAIDVASARSIFAAVASVAICGKSATALLLSTFIWVEA